MFRAQRNTESPVRVPACSHAYGQQRPQRGPISFMSDAFLVLGRHEAPEGVKSRSIMLGRYKKKQGMVCGSLESDIIINFQGVQLCALQITADWLLISV